MGTNSNKRTRSGPEITIDIPAQDARIFRSKAIDELLLFLSRYADEEFSITNLADALDYSRPTVSKAVNVLSSNDLVVERQEGPSQMIHVNPERLHLPDDPYFQIPQAEFQTPVKMAVETIVDELENVIAVVLYGSVARGDADRRSDIDLWVLVTENRMENQQRVNRIRQQLEEEEFEGGRYAYEIDVETLQAVPNYTTELREILSDGITIHKTEEFETVKSMIFHGSRNE